MIFFPSKKKGDFIYPLTWVTPQLAVGHAPMSIAELDSIKHQGIRGIMNLCMEIRELVALEEQQGFEVYYLPVRDEGFPEINELEKALDWLDECIYLGKKVLVHCRFGIGRTGTIVYAYLLRKGYDTKSAARKMRGIRSQPTEQPQKRFLHQYWKKEKPYKISMEPSLAPGYKVDLQPYYDQTKAALSGTEADVPENAARCGKDHCQCCFTPVTMSLAEAVYLQFGINTQLSSTFRQQAIDRAMASNTPSEDRYPEKKPPCPLLDNDVCLLYAFRPAQCRVFDRTTREMTKNSAWQLMVLSHELLEVFLEDTTPYTPPEINLPDVVSGKFVQQLFHLMAGDSADPVIPPESGQ
ncbi:Fe-S-cluster containining protein [Desulfosalsimonas propionicica]|uniref:protein-tyrosine-phosphatase n=1 Tax=Desulfosalsimonas propionicica TaxID=332175 RepID=A0A7W0C7P3_9BACT|nr:dual specificity protein phosphatase family protein [Desulfosalsimonas propionicica]MBA2880585.1 Fe-S-cluster containining protein [Desulfosalsimonas propionicica]